MYTHMMFTLLSVVLKTYTIVRPMTSKNLLLVEEDFELLGCGDGALEPFVGSGPAS